MRCVKPVGDGQGRDRLNFIGVWLDGYTLTQAVELATVAMRTRSRFQHGDVNVAKLVSFRRDPELRRCVAKSDLICADGMGIVWGCRLMGVSVPERVTGIDLMSGVIDVCAREGFRPYFFGARQDVLEKAVTKIRQRYPSLSIAGMRNGYYGPEEEENIVAEIRASAADCLFVGISSPIKEKFLSRYRDVLGAPVQIGVGGSFDVLAGVVRRAPERVQRLGLEWLFRLVQEPRRLGWRYLSTNLEFVVVLISSLARESLMSNRPRPH